MYDLGHQIVGVDVSVKAMQQFFEENQLEYSTNQLAMKGTIYKACLILVFTLSMALTNSLLFKGKNAWLSKSPTGVQ